MDDQVPACGDAVVFFPSTANGVVDKRLLHEAKPVISGDKWVLQVWVRQRSWVGAHQQTALGRMAFGANLAAFAGLAGLGALLSLVARH